MRILLNEIDFEIENSAGDFIALTGAAAAVEGLCEIDSDPVEKSFRLDDWAGVRSFIDATDDTGD